MGRPQAWQGLVGRAALLPLKELAGGRDGMERSGGARAVCAARMMACASGAPVAVEQCPHGLLR